MQENYLFEKDFEKRMLYWNDNEYKESLDKDIFLLSRADPFWFIYTNPIHDIIFIDVETPEYEFHPYGVVLNFMNDNIFSHGGTGGNVIQTKGFNSGYDPMKINDFIGELKLYNITEISGDLLNHQFK